MKRILSGLVIVICVAGIMSAQGGKRPLSLDDLGRIKECAIRSARPTARPSPSSSRRST